ncbi:hypothetical protein ACUOA8_03250, partial [Escherichia sp. SS-MK2]
MKGTAVVKQCETLLAPYSAKRLVTKKSPAISLISQAATGRVGLFNFNFSASSVSHCLTTAVPFNACFYRRLNILRQ